MISESDKEEALALIQEASKAGARKHLAAELLGLGLRTVQRWEKHGFDDHRKGSRAVPGNKISQKEMLNFVSICLMYSLTSEMLSMTLPHMIEVSIFS